MKFNPNAIALSDVGIKAFDWLFYAYLSTQEHQNFQDKIKFIQHFLREIDDLSNACENQNILTHWASIGSVFSAAASLSGLALLNPLIGSAVAVSAASSAAMVVGGAIARNAKLKPILEELHRYKLALKSSPANDWAALWEYLGDEDQFVDALGEASLGHILNFKLVREDKKNPFAAGLDYLCPQLNIDRDVLVAHLRTIKNGGKVQAPQPTPVIIPPIYSPTPQCQPEYIDTVIQAPQPTVQTESRVHESSNVFDIAKAIASPVQNCVILGVGGSGKGILVSNALRKIKAENPYRKIFYIDPKNEPKEYGYLDGVVDVVRRKTCENKCPEEICDWLDSVLDEYVQWSNQQQESLLVVDEGMVLGDACKKTKNTRIGTLILHIASLGGAGRKNAWLVTQTPFVGAMGLNLTSSSQMKWVTLVGENDAGVIKQWTKASTMESISLDRLGVLVNESPVNRAVYWGGTSKWYAIPKYENYSAIDRDKNTPNGDALNTEHRQSLRDAERRITDAQQKMIEALERSHCTNLEEFIVRELGAGDRLHEVKDAIVRTIKKSEHYGLAYKFRID